jgi:hypothetical protein
MLRCAGIVALLVVVACGQTSTAAPAQSPVVAQGTWDLDLTFKGDVSGHMTGIIPNTPSQTNECTGVKARNGQAWSDTFYGNVDASGAVWEVVFYVGNYRGPGTYTAADSLSVVVSSPIDITSVWQNGSSDPVSFTIHSDQRSGTVNATMSNATTGKPTLQLSGGWNCRG